LYSYFGLIFVLNKSSLQSLALRSKHL